MSVEDDDAHLDTLHHRVPKAQHPPQIRMQLLGTHLTRVHPARLTGPHRADIIHLAAELLTITARQLGENLHQRRDGAALPIRGRTGILHRSRDVRDGRRGQFVSCFTHDGVDKVGSAETASHQGRDVFTVGRADLDVAADVREDLVVAECGEGEFTPVGVGGKILPAR